MNLLNLIEDTTTGYDNLRALMQASQSGQDAVLNIGGETITLDPMETRWIFAKYKAFNKAGRQEEFLNHLADPVKFDQHMKQLRQLIDKQKNFQGSIPGERGVTGDTMPGQMEEDQAVEEIAMANPDRPTTQTAGKINWERMIKDYMENKPYSEFEFAGDRPLTLYRSQIYAILKDFGRMKPQQKVNIILNTFGDKLAMVDYIDKLRAKGMMPKKVPAYVAPGTEPVPPGQMDLPGMGTPKIKEAEAQKKNSEITELDRKSMVNPRVARAFQLARARQSAAGSDIEAFVQDELEKSQAAQAEIDQLRKDNDSQDQQMQQLAAVVQQQDQEIQQLKQQPEPVVAKTAPEVPAKPAVKPEEPQATQPKAAEKPAEPEVATQPQQQPTDVAQPAPEKKKKPAVRKKAAPKKTAPKKIAEPTVIQAPPYVEIPKDDGKVIPISRARKKKSDAAVDPMAAALQGVDMGDFGKAVGMNESNEELHIGDPVIIGGNVEHAGKTGDVSGFGRDKHFVIVDLYNFGKHAFHASNVKYNDYADEEDYVEEGRFKDLDIEQQWKAGQQASQNFKRREQSAGEEEPVGDFRVVRRKDGIVSDLKQHHSSNKAFAHAQALKKKYPSMEIGVRWPTGTINWTGIARENQRMDKFNIAQPTPGGSNKQREEFLNARDRLFRQMANASPGEKEAIRLKIAELEGRAQSQGIKIRETEDLNRSGYNAITTVSDWAEKMRVMRELQKDIALMSDPEAKAAIQQRIGDLLKVGIKQGYIKEALNDKAMSVLRSLQQPAQPAPAAVDLNTPAGPRRGRPSNAQRTQRHEEFLSLRRHIALLDELIQMKEQIDKLFLKAQNVRGGIYPGLQADIEMEELYPVPETDRQFQDLKDKYTKDLAALQKFLAMKKAVYREDEDSMLGESTALVRLKQARQALSQQGVAEGQTDYQKRRARERDVDAGKPVARQPKNPQTDYAKKRAKDRRDIELGEDQLDEKQDACYNKVKSRYKVWPSAYASGALVQCRKKGADNWGNGGKKK